VQTGAATHECKMVAQLVKILFFEETKSIMNFQTCNIGDGIADYAVKAFSILGQLI